MNPLWQLLDGPLIQADCMEAMRAMPPESVDAIVTDPPYGLSFMGKGWDTFDPTTMAERVGKRDGTGPPSDVRDGRSKGRASSAFANPGGEAGAYDFSTRGQRAFQAWCEAWASEALRVLKPGGHLLAFGGTRTSHRLACAIEDAGFEIRDSLMWLYGSGFPKSLDVSKAIDKARRRDYVAAAVKLGLDIPGNSLHDWTKAEHAPSDQWWERFKAVLSADDWQAIEREVIGTADKGDAIFGNAQGEYDLTAPATPDAERWQGWGTALKPGHEPIVVARKPFAGTIAVNVLEHGTGAMNIDGCRVGFAGADDEAETKGKNRHGDFGTEHGGNSVYGDYTRDEPRENYDPPGRWPANVVLSHSEGCRRVGIRTVRGDGHFPADRGASGYGSAVEDSTGGGLKGQSDLEERHLDDELVEEWACEGGCPVTELDRQSGEVGSGWKVNYAERYAAEGRQYEGGNFGGGGYQAGAFSDAGGASRFFYTAKASRAERNAGLDQFEKRALLWSNGEQNPGAFQSDATEREARNFHPTVKPIALMRWLVRLVTPPGGIVLDPFTGSGTTGCAAVLEGFDFIGIERDAEYVGIARARIAWWARHPEGVETDRVYAAERRRAEMADAGQGGLF